MGCGDWNDGMNLVGAGGKGESVWVAWFQVLVRTEFAAVAELRGDVERAERMRSQAGQLRAAIEEQAWDGDWYLRAWFDDGTPLGSKANDECKIDSLPQSWAVLAGAVSSPLSPGLAGEHGGGGGGGEGEAPATSKDSVPRTESSPPSPRPSRPASGGEAERQRRAVTAVDAAVERLVDRDNRLVKLFTPPFDAGSLQPGYIKGYVPGIRENGGQYTHAAIWLVQALAGLGRGGQAHELWRMLSPISHADTPEAVARYKVEPYVVAADVYGMPPHVGRGGWTWYTGSASWLYRAALETLLGFTVRGNTLRFDPRVPANWPGFELEYRHGKTTYRCRVENPTGVELGVREVSLDGSPVPGGAVPLTDDEQTHEVRIVLGT
jgi:cyclic beta-1,2-glucan synthetase